MMYGWGDNGASWWMMVVNGLFMVAIIVAVVCLVVWVARQSTTTTATPASKTPRAVLEMRYARGEIDADEFRTRLATLNGTSGEGKVKPA